MIVNTLALTKLLLQLSMKCLPVENKCKKARKSEDWKVRKLKRNWFICLRNTGRKWDTQIWWQRKKYKWDRENKSKQKRYVKRLKRGFI